MTKGRKVQGRLEARRLTYKDPGDGSRKRPGSHKKPYPRGRGKQHGR